MLKVFFEGFSYVIRGKRLAKSIPGVFIWILMPFIIDMILLGIGIYFGAGLVQLMAANAIGWLFGGVETIWSQLVYYPLLAMLTLGFVVMAVYITFVLASVIASPFYGVLAEKTLVHLKIIPDSPFDLKRTLKQALSMLVVSLKRAVILGLIGVILFICSFIPGLNLVAAYTAFILMAMDSADFSFEARAYNLGMRMSYLKNNFKEFLGMGAFVGLTLLIPGLILIIMPYAVIGAADMMAKIEQRSKAIKN